MRRALIALCILLLAPLTPAVAQISINFGSPGVSIGINLGNFPTLQRIPGYPVYYAPGVNSNYFFYDGLYWVYQNDNWYASSWYNGPWTEVDPMDVPVFLLRVPVRYYRHAPAYFRGWRADAPPRWDEHWGRSWEQRRSGWEQWNRSSAPAPAPLPTYQRQYTGSRYPQASQQAVLESRNYRYQPRDAVAQQQFRQRREQAQSAPQQQTQQPNKFQRAQPQAPAPQQQQVQQQQRQQQQQVQQQQQRQQQQARTPSPRPEKAQPQATPQPQPQPQPNKFQRMQPQQGQPAPQQQNPLQRRAAPTPAPAPQAQPQAPRAQPARPPAQEHAQQGKGQDKGGDNNGRGNGKGNKDNKDNKDKDNKDEKDKGR